MLFLVNKEKIYSVIMSMKRTTESELNSQGGMSYNKRIAGRIICRPSFVTTICSFQFNVTGSGVEAVRDAPLLGLKLL